MEIDFDYHGPHDELVASNVPESQHYLVVYGDDIVDEFETYNGAYNAAVKHADQVEDSVQVFKMVADIGSVLPRREVQVYK